MKCHISRLSANSIVKVTLSFTISTSHLSSQTGMSSMYTLFFWANIAFGSVCNCNTAQLHFPNVFLTVWCVSPENWFDRVKSLCCDIVRLLWLCALWDYTDIVFCALWVCDTVTDQSIQLWSSDTLCTTAAACCNTLTLVTLHKDLLTWWHCASTVSLTDLDQ